MHSLPDISQRALNINSVDQLDSIPIVTTP